MFCRVKLSHVSDGLYWMIKYCGKRRASPV